LILDVENPATALERLARVLREGSFVCLNFRSRAEIKVLGSLGRVIPPGCKMGSLALRELCFAGAVADTVDVADLALLRNLLGPAPLEVRCSGLQPADVNLELARRVVGLVRGQVEVVDFGVDPPLSVVRYMAAQGLACTLRGGAPAETAGWFGPLWGFLAR
jgi:hypothetical protein